MPHNWLRIIVNTYIEHSSMTIVDNVVWAVLACMIHWFLLEDNLMIYLYLAYAGGLGLLGLSLLNYAQGIV